MGKAAHDLLALVLAAIPLGAQADAHLYSLGTNLEPSELAQLETATRSVDVAMYSFTDRELAEELAALAHRGVRIRVYRDREQFSQELQFGGVTTTSFLLAAGIEVRERRERSHAPQELRRRWATLAFRFRKLVTHGTQAPGQLCAL